MPTITNTRSPKPGVYPFWFWNGVQEESRIAEQLEAMKAGGCRGVVLHSREGNRIPYLSERWFELVLHSCDCAKRLGLTIWLYDEDGYPSGNAGMQVQKLRPDLRQKQMLFAYAGTDPDTPAYAAYDATTYAPLDETAVPRGTPALRFTPNFIARHVDTFSREAADLFISLTHAHYVEHLAPYFGNVVEAVYTDDESFQVWNGTGLPWSEILEAEYERRHGEPLRSILPQLVEDLPGAADVRLRFYSLCRQLFLENFIAPQVDWCRKAGLPYVGHLCGDEGPTRNAVKNFGTAMPYLLAQDIPSIDDYLCEIKDHGYLRKPLNGPETRFLLHDARRLFTHLIYKGASSIANQFKNGLVSVEDLTFIGWDVEPAFLNTQMLFELALGANLMTPHAYYYTIGDRTKYDCPPSYFTQQPLHPVFGRRCATWTRIAELLLRGAFHADCLVVFPDRIVESQTGTDIDAKFALRKPRERISPDEFDVHFNTLLMELARRHVGYELGEDAIMAERAQLRDGAIVLGKRAYGTAICLSGVAISPSTARLLERFKASGGRVLTLPPGEYAALDALAPDLPLSGDGCEEILVHARDNAGFREALLLNLSGRTLAPTLEINGDFLVYDPVGETAFKTRDHLPAGFVLEHGGACMVMPTDFPCAVVPYETTVFRPSPGWEALTPLAITPLRPNAAAFHKTCGFAFELAPGATVTAIYTEHLAESGLTVNGTAALAATVPHHPCDFCFEGASAAGLCHAGANALALDAERDMVYLEGDFVFEDGRLQAPRPLALGDLAAAGWPHYWGAVEYVFAFDGRRDVLRLELAGGAAEIRVNGRLADPVFGLPATVRIADLCADCANELVVRLHNTAANFVTANPARFGLVKAEIA